MKYIKIFIAVLAVLTIVLLVAKYKFGVNPPISLLEKDYKENLPLDSLSLPDGFTISIYADSVVNARSMCYSQGGTLFVSTRSEGNVYALKDMDGDNKIDK